jgi:hypothetical protein
MGKNEVEIIVTAEDRASGVLSNIGGALGGVGRIATGAAIGGIALVGGALAMAGRSAIAMNSDLETSQLQFETLMGDATRAEEHVRSLFDFAAKTPFETGPIIEASRIMQVFGGDALNTDENLTRIGDTAAAVGAPIEDIGFWVGRAYAAIQGGQPFGEAAQNLMQMGAVSPDVIAKMNEMRDAGASQDEIFKVLTDHMDGYSGAMEKQAGTWSGLMATISDSLNMAAATAMKPFFDLAKEGLAGLAEWFNSPAIQAGLTMIAEKLTVVIGAITDFVSGIMSGEDPIGDLANLAWTLAGAFGATDEQAKKVFDAVRKVGDQIAAFAAPIITAITNFVSFKDVLIALGLAILATVIPAIISMVITMAPILLTIAAIIAVVALLRNAWENNWGGIQEKVQAVIAFIVPFIQNALQMIQQWWAENGGAILAKAQADLSALQAAFIAAITFIRDMVNTFLTNLKAWWAESGGAVIATVTQMWELVKGLFDGATKHLNLIGEAFRLAFAGEWEAFGAKLFEIWENAWNTVVEFLGGLWDMILPWLVDMWDSMRIWFSTIDWGGLGRTIVDGIVGGLRAAGGAIIEVLMGFAQSAWESIMNFFNGGGDGTGRSGGRGSVAVTPTASTGRSSTGGRGVVVNIDARGAGKGVDNDLRRMVEDVMRQYANKADVRMRTV